MTDNFLDDPAGQDQDFSLTVEATDAGKRLDAVLAAHLEALSRNSIQSLIRSGRSRCGRRAE
jgi:23S rRNA pseudouridine1911/1915/1917 synthase